MSHKVYTYVYDESNNEVIFQKIDLTYDKFLESNEANLFAAWYVENSVKLSDTTGQTLLLNDVTIEQAIILFYNLLADKERAKEED